MTLKVGTSMDHVARNWFRDWWEQHSITGNKVSKFYPVKHPTTEDRMTEMLVEFWKYLEGRQ